MEQSQIAGVINNNHQNAPKELRRERQIDKDDKSIDESVQTRGKQDTNLGSVKMKIPTFHGKSDPKAYLAWEKKVGFVFYCHNYFDETKVKFATVSFMGCTLAWWN